MRRRLIHLTCSVVLLSLALASPVSAELVGHWKLDENSGTTALDSSGNGNDGAVSGGAQWQPGNGRLGGALDFDGSTGYVEIPFSESLRVLNQGDFTLTAWFKTDVIPAQTNMVFQQADGNGTGRGWLYIATNTGDIMTYLGGAGTSSGVNVEIGAWYHTALVVTELGNTDSIQLYVDGEPAGAPGQLGMEDSEGMYFIGRHKVVDNRVWEGLIDDVRLYNHALLGAELLAAIKGSSEGYPYALSPYPADGTLLEATWANVSWRAGDSAVSHDVYLGDNYDDVNDGLGDSFQGNQAGISLVIGFPGFAVPGGLVPGTTYYWRIDEVNETDPNSPWKGDIWSFTVPPREAYEPSPADDAMNALQDVTLSWTAGFSSKLHSVYFGDNFDDVSIAEGALPQAETTYTPGVLDMDKTYYWRVDEFDGALTHKGDVWNFTTVPDIAVTNPNLTLWWTLDEGEDATAVDWSGHGNHGTIVGGTEWVDGYQCTALTFGDDVYVEASGYDGVTGAAARTLCAWIRTSMANRTIISWGLNAAGQKWRMYPNGATGGLRLEVNGGYKYGVTNIADGRWHHVAVTFEDDGTPDVLDTLLYVDGQPDATADSADEPIDTATTGVVRIGESPWHNQPFVGVIDDARIYDKVLTAEDVQQVMLGNTKLAGNPVPDRNTLVDIRDISSLSFSAGDGAASHDVYFGTDRDAVAGADNGSPQFQSNQAGTSLSLATLVEFGGGDYYWRIDEVEADGTVHAGTIWKFKVPDYLIVDNLESYDNIDPAPGEPGINRIFDKWIDGFGTLTNGALVGNDLPPYAERTIVHGGAQSMIYRYDNAGKTSEATLTVAKRDWTAEGVTKLSLWLRGASANAANRIYVALNGTAVVYHDDPAATQLSSWTEWVIDLSASGVGLTNVNSITIGIGTKGSPAAGGAGTMYFDDIRLVR
ncbi:MAG: hypothetical protein ISS70_26775 [Phycisphaerae bacterium]|nr:hypothetical protein [Phycisphaerae bacterium]